MKNPIADLLKELDEADKHPLTQPLFKALKKRVKAAIDAQCEQWDGRTGISELEAAVYSECCQNLKGKSNQRRGGRR